ncbi:MAG TPA: hypothetical protein VEP90_18510, partial [Methylomirabilota bacterium]|nr:hypothetical protein [Methylomirabilota bacterium]
MRKIITASFTNQVLQLRKKNVSTAKIAKQLHASYDTIINAIHLLKKQGLLPEFHSLDPRVKDSNGKTFHTKQLDLLIFNLLKVNHKLHNREIVELLAEQQRLNKKISILTVERSRLRLIKEGLLNRRIATPAETLKIDMQVEKLRLRGLTNSEIASRLGLSVPRVKSGLY